MQSHRLKGGGMDGLFQVADGVEGDAFALQLHQVAHTVTEEEVGMTFLGKANVVDSHRQATHGVRIVEIKKSQAVEGFFILRIECKGSMEGSKTGGVIITVVLRLHIPYSNYSNYSDYSPYQPFSHLFYRR